MMISHRRTITSSEDENGYDLIDSSYVCVVLAKSLGRAVGSIRPPSDNQTWILVRLSDLLLPSRCVLKCILLLP